MYSLLGWASIFRTQTRRRQGFGATQGQSRGEALDWRGVIELCLHHATRRENMTGTLFALQEKEKEEEEP